MTPTAAERARAAAVACCHESEVCCEGCLEAAILDAEQAATERCFKALCIGCANGWPGERVGDINPPYMHVRPDSVHVECRAEIIRRLFLDSPEK